jgi:hypothetical protein
MADSDNKRLLAALEANWQAEMEGHHTYLHWPKEGLIQRGERFTRSGRCRKSIMPAFWLDAFWNRVDWCPARRE